MVCWKDYSLNFQPVKWSLSAREIYWQVKDFENKVKKSINILMIFELIGEIIF